MRWTVTICALLGLFAPQNTGPQVHKQGAFVIADTFAVDVDDGRVGIHDSDAAIEKNGQSSVLIIDGENESPLPFHGYFKGSDFWFEHGKQRFLHPQHGANFSKIIVGSSGYKACASARYSGNALRVDKLAPGTHVCMRTSEGRYTDITIQGYDPGTFRFTVAYTTWEK